MIETLSIVIPEPRDWIIVEFSFVLKEGTRNGIYKQKEFHGFGDKIVNMGELFGHPRLFSVPMKRVKLSESEGLKFRLEVGDLLFARRSLVAEGAGKCSIVCEIKEPTTFESSIIRARPNSKIADSYYLYYLFNSPYGTYILDTIRRQVAVSGITGTDLVKLPIPLPPLSEQKAIAHILGTLDDKIELNQQMNQTLEAIAKAIFKSWFVDFDPVRAKMEGRQPVGMDAATAELFPDSFEESALGLIPKGWRVGTLRDCCQKIENGGTPKRSESTYWNPNVIPWLTSGEVRQKIVFSTENFISEQGLLNSSAKMWPSGTTVVALYGATAGQVCLLAEAMCSNQACCGLNPSQNMKFFLYLKVSSSVELLEQQARGSAQQNLSQQLVADFSCVIPSIYIMKNFEQYMTPLFSKWIANLKKSCTIAKIRDTLLPKLMSGEIRVKEAETMIEEAV